MDTETLTGLLSFLHKAENLKNTLRSAHTSTGRQESTAEHTWRLCLLVMLLERYFTGLDTCKLLKLAVVHDLGEAVCGDIPAVEQSGGPDKSALERAGMLELCEVLPPGAAQELLDLWDEYEAAATPEAQVIKGLDKLETLIQHNQGLNPAGFDYAFNLGYGRKYTDAHPVLRQIRDVLDDLTRENAARQHEIIGS